MCARVCVCVRMCTSVNISGEVKHDQSEVERIFSSLFIILMREI